MIIEKLLSLKVYSLLKGVTIFRVIMVLYIFTDSLPNLTDVLWVKGWPADLAVFISIPAGGRCCFNNKKTILQEWSFHMNFRVIPFYRVI